MSELREDLVASAVAFLHDPAVASASLEKRIEFLKSKELTQQEIDEALSRAEKSAPEPSTEAAPVPSTEAPTAPQTTTAPTVTPPPIPAYSYAAYAQPPPVPKRDWKDYFVMAATTVGVSYAMYEVAKRYVLPLILPPSPEVLDAATENLEEEFKNAQALLDKLQEQNAELKRSEIDRTKKVEEMISELESTLQLVQLQVSRGDKDMELITQQIDAVKEAIPKDLKVQSDVQAKELTDVLSDLKSLKQIVTTRNQPSSPKPTTPPQIPNAAPTTSTFTNPPPITPAASTPSPMGSTSTAAPRIPAWQLAASSSKST